MKSITLATAIKEVNLELVKKKQDKRRVVFDFEVASMLQDKLRAFDATANFNVCASKGYILTVTFGTFFLFEVRARRERHFLELSIVELSLQIDAYNLRDRMAHNVVEFVTDEQKRLTDTHREKTDKSIGIFQTLLGEYGVDIADFNMLREEFDKLPRTAHRELRNIK